MTFANTLELIESFRDRHGCGDELFLDTKFRIDALLAALDNGFDRVGDTGESDDDAAAH